MLAPSQTPYQVRIRPRRSWLRVDWRELWEYRDLLFLLVWRDFIAKYKQTILGPAWFVIQPILMTLVFTVVFGNIARIPTDGLPPVLFYLCGLLGWNYFANTLNGTATTFTANAAIFGKVYFPRLVVPFSVAISNLFAWVLQVVTFFAFWGYFRMFTAAGESLSLEPQMLWMIPLVGQTVLLALGVGLWISSITAKYRDLAHMLNFLTQLWMYATPIIYPFSQVPEAWRWVVALNPMVSIVEGYKTVLLGQGLVTGPAVAWSLAATLGLFFTGLLVFHRTERNVIDTV